MTSINSTFTLEEILGWKAEHPVSAPMVVVNNNLTNNADSISSTFIAHCIQTGGTVYVLDAMHSAVHYEHTCKKLGIDLDKAKRNGLYFYMNCLTKNEDNTSTPWPNYTLEHFADHIARFFAHWQSLQVTNIATQVRTCTSAFNSQNSTFIDQNPLLPRFNIVVGDIEAIADVYANGSVSAVVDFIDFLVELVSTPKRDVSTVLTPVNAMTGEVIAPIKNADVTIGPKGSVLVVCSPDSDDSSHTNGLTPVPSQTPASFTSSLSLPIIPTSSSTVNLSSSKVKSVTQQEDLFDLPIRRTSPIAGLLLHHPSSQLFLDLCPLPSGYSVDVHSQLIITRFPVILQNGVPSKGRALAPQIVFLEINNKGPVKCYSRG